MVFQQVISTNGLRVVAAVSSSICVLLETRRRVDQLDGSLALVWRSPATFLTCKGHSTGKSYARQRENNHVPTLLPMWNGVVLFCNKAVAVALRTVQIAWQRLSREGLAFQKALKCRRPERMNQGFLRLETSVTPFFSEVDVRFTR